MQAQGIMYPTETETLSVDNAYRRVERIYKQHHIVAPNRRKPIKAEMPDLSQVIDFEHPNEHIFKVNFKPNDYYEEALKKYKSECPGMDLSPIEEWHVYGLKNYDGFYFVKGLIPSEQQLYWMNRCVRDYPNPPNITNLKAVYGDDAGKNVWENAMQSKKGIIKVTTDPTPETLLKKMSWSTLGYQYNWTARKYYQQEPVAFPPDIASLTTLVAHAAGSGPYIPEAAIVNYYKRDGNMGGHLDNAEYEMKKPIISISFGCDAIFLLGGETKSIEPIPMLLRSGDVMIMGGRSRYCYHGIARIISETIPSCLSNINIPTEYTDLAEYMIGRRININTRQVFEYDK